jgi:asparagine N-glycosylation enzyme membrane subunit Stt3
MILWVAPEILPFNFGSRFWSILNPLFRNEISIVASVAEQMPSAWSVFYYNTLIPLTIIPLGVYFCFKRLNAADIFVITFVILMYYFTGSMIRIILIFAPAAALAGAYGLASILKIFGSFVGEKKVGISRKRRRQLKGTLGNSEAFVVFFLVGILMYAQVTHASDISINQMAYAQLIPGGALHDWEESLTWMKNNLDGTDVVASWWDYGYWLTPIGNVTTVNDNATKNTTRIGLTGMALMQTNEIYSARAFKRLRADYVMVYWGFLFTGLGGDEGKWTWMVSICNDNYENYKMKGWEEDNWADNAVFDMNTFVNQTSGFVEAGWFQTQLSKLLFWGEPTSVEDARNQVEENYARQINQRYDDNGETWRSHIPDNGIYESMVFIPEYWSLQKLVKLYRIDYTVLDSSFFIKNPEVIESGYATFKIKNTGKKDLQINKVEINGVNYNFVMGGGTQTLEHDTEDLVWVDLEGAGFQKDDVVNINITAQSEALYGRTYTFQNSTSNFFVKEAESGEIKINKENSIVIQKDSSLVDLYLEVENVGDSIVVLDRFYANNDTVDNRFDPGNIEYLSGTPVLEPTDSAYVLIQNATVSFSPIRNYNKIGVATPNNIYDEILMTSNIENYSLSILSEDRILSPEVQATLNGYLRKHIPIDFNTSYGYIYDNGSTILKINIKNTGDVIFILDSVYLNGVDPIHAVEFDDFYTQSGFLTLDSNDEDVIIVDATDYVSGDVNEEILVCVTGSFGTTVASDIGYIHTVSDQPNITIIRNIQDLTTSVIYANETGKLLLKNTGNELVNLDNIYINNTPVSNINYIYGDSSLDIQDCAIVTFDFPGFEINESTEVEIKVTTTDTAQTIETFFGYVDATYHKITIDDGGTTAIDGGDLTISINNDGRLNVTIDAVYINNTYFSLDAFNELIFEIGAGGSIQLTIDMAIIESELGAINPGDELVIIVRSREGAESTHLVIVT